MAIHNKKHDLGPLFTHGIKLEKKSPIFHRYPSHEVDYPYRWSNSLIVRIPWCRQGFVLGLWRSTNRTEEQMLLEALEGRQMDTDEFSDAERVHIRRTMIKNQFSAEQQELLVEALDI